MERTILIATSNPGKMADMRAVLERAGFMTKTLADFGLGDIDEVGATFEEIAVLKARHYAKASGLVAVADDGGLEIDALGGAPGIKSKRWLGENATWEDLARGIVGKMRGIPREGRTARIRSAVAAALPDGRAATVQASIEGYVCESLDESKIIAGYPYRALLVVNAYGKLYADLTEEEHEKVNQRRKALEEIIPKLRELCG